VDPGPERMKSIFFAALEQTPDERAAFIAQQCNGDADLSQKVHALLAAHDRAGPFMGAPTAGGAPPPSS
jgi:hypothetical protein